MSDELFASAAEGVSPEWLWLMVT